ncbi:MAG: glycoside hydrolase family 97 N-terminal domain-containing protein, partial [Bacteroidota bacterium]
MIRLVALAFSLVLASPAPAPEPASSDPTPGNLITVSSPDGRTVVSIHTTDLGYSVTYDGEPLVERSRLGVVLSDGDTLGVGFVE